MKLLIAFIWILLTINISHAGPATFQGESILLFKDSLKFFSGLTEVKESSGDLILQAGDSAGTNEIKFVDSDEVKIGGIDSDGEFDISGGVSIAKQASFNNAAGDNDFTINKNTSGVAYKYDAGIDQHQFLGGIKTVSGGLINLNLMNNADFESSDLTMIDVTDAAATRSAEMIGQALTCTLNADTGGCGDQAITTGAGYAGVNMTLSLWVKTSADLVDICVYANGAELAGSCQSNKDNNTGTVRDDGNWYKYTFDFVADTTSVGWFVDAPTNSDVIYIDNVSLAPSSNVGEVAQAGFFGSLKWATTASCSWSKTAADWTNFSADADCDDNVRVATDGLGHVSSGTAIANDDGQLPKIEFSSLPSGRYEFTIRGFIYKASTNDMSCLYRLSDGTNNSTLTKLYPGTSYSSSLEFSGEFSYSSTQANTTHIIQAYSSDGAGACRITIDTLNELEISVKYFPPQSSIYRDDDQWFIAGYISGANSSLGVANVASYTEITDAGLTLTPNTGSAPVGIACATGTASVVGGYTCGVNESVGITFNRSGKVECEMKFSTYSSDDSSGKVLVNFELNQTTASSSAIVTESGDRANLGAIQMAAGEGVTSTRFAKGIFDCTGQCTLRVMYEQLISGTPLVSNVLADADATMGQYNIYFQCKPINTKINASFADVYKIPGSSTGNPVIVSALIAADATISEEDDNFLASCTDADPRVCTTTTSYFKADPKCWATPTVAGNLANVTGDTTTTITIDVTDVSTSFNLFCQGVK